MCGCDVSFVCQQRLCCFAQRRLYKPLRRLHEPVTAPNPYKATSDAKARAGEQSLGPFWGRFGFRNCYEALAVACLGLGVVYQGLLAMKGAWLQQLPDRRCIDFVYVCWIKDQASVLPQRNLVSRCSSKPWHSQYWQVGCPPCVRVQTFTVTEEASWR